MADHDEHDPRDEGIRLLASDQPAPAASTPSVWAAAAGEDLDELDDPWAVHPDGGVTSLSGSDRLDVGPASGPVPLPAWTQPATGQVPRVVIGDDEAGWASRTGSQPRWRGDQDDWTEGDFDDGMLEEGDGTRMGALDSSRDDRAELYSFEEDLPSQPQPVVTIGEEPAQEAVSPVAQVRSRPRVDGAPVGSGGRNMQMAFLVGGGFFVAAVVLFLLVKGTWGAWFLATGIVVAGAYELFGVFQRAGLRPASLLGITACFALMWGVWARGLQAMPLVLALSFAATMLWYITKVIHARPLLGVAATMLGIVWIGFLGSFAALMLHLGSPGKPLLFGAIICTVASDIGGLLVGSAIGRTPLAPEVSPNKTVEGVLGGLLLSIAAGCITGLVSKQGWDHSIVNGFLLGLVVGIAAPLGDLSQSLIKRDLGVKDMGESLPGHGGFLDRFDSLFFALPATYFLAVVLSLPHVRR